MTEEELEKIARDSRNAQRLIEDDVFRDAIKALTDEALQRLINADPSNMRDVIQAQESVKLCHGLLVQLAIKMDLHKAVTARPKIT